MAKRNLILFFIAFFSALSSLCIAQDGSQRKIKIMGDRSLPPYEYFNREFEPIGFNVDLVKEIMDRLDIPYEIQLDSWANVVDSLNSGKAALEMGMIYNADRGDLYKFVFVH